MGDDNVSFLDVGQEERERLLVLLVDPTFEVLNTVEVSHLLFEEDAVGKLLKPQGTAYETQNVSGTVGIL